MIPGPDAPLNSNEDGSVHGMASYVITDAVVEGKVVPTAYMCDARVAKTMEAESRRQWRQFYVETVENSHELEEFEKCEYMFSAILDANKIALRAFTKKDSPLEFVPTQNYQAQQVIGKKWFASRSDKYSVRKVSLEELDRVKSFLVRASEERALGLSLAEIERRLESWEDLNEESFLVCVDSSDRWLALTAPVSFTHSRSLVVDDAPKSLLFLSKAARLFGGPSLVKGKDIKTTYLTHLEFNADLDEDERLWCVRSFLDHLFDKVVTQEQNMLSFVWPKGVRLSGHPSLSCYIMQKTNGTYYQVYPKSRAGTLKKFEREKNFSFEVALA